MYEAALRRCKYLFFVFLVCVGAITLTGCTDSVRIEDRGDPTGQCTRVRSSYVFGIRTGKSEHMVDCDEPVL